MQLQQRALTESGPAVLLAGLNPASNEVVLHACACFAHPIAHALRTPLGSFALFGRVAVTFARRITLVEADYVGVVAMFIIIVLGV